MARGHASPASRLLPGKIRIGCLIAAIVVVVLLLAFGAYFVYRHGIVYFDSFDSDVKAVPRWIIDDRLQMWFHTRLPPSAREVHVLLVGGPDPVMLLRFTADADEAARFAEQVLRPEDRTAEEAVPPKWVDEMTADRSWWKPSQDVPWRGRRDGGGTLIAQSERATGIVYFIVHLILQRHLSVCAVGLRTHRARMAVFWGSRRVRRPAAQSGAVGLR